MPPPSKGTFDDHVIQGYHVTHSFCILLQVLGKESKLDSMVNSAGVVHSNVNDTSIMNSLPHFPLEVSLSLLQSSLRHLPRLPWGHHHSREQMLADLILRE